MTSLTFTSTGSSILPKEVDIQKLCWEWLAYVSCERERFLQDYAFMVPNGTQLPGNAVRYMASLKAQGFRPGVSDLVIAYPVWREDPKHDGPICYHGMYVELKRDRKSYGGPAAIASAVRKEQKEWLERMEDVGYWACLAYGFDEFKSLVRSYLAKEIQPPLPWNVKE